ncbi:MAG: hypothetical protein GYA42_06075, partial [Syntrophomonadaceae bacterium]|nr:hypothetical protein [Syntrophomonadaceae bacterium]
MLEQPRWGFFDVILVYLGILGVTLLGSIIPLRLELGITAFFFLSFSIQFLATVSFVYLFAVVLPRGGWPDLGVRKP